MDKGTLEYEKVGPEAHGERSGSPPERMPDPLKYGYHDEHFGKYIDHQQKMLQTLYNDRPGLSDKYGEMNIREE